MLIAGPRMARGLILMIAIVGLACEHSRPAGVAALLPGVKPFEHLAGVELDMTAAELRTVRPAVRNAPYFGLQDTVEGDVVEFRFPQNVREDMETPMDDRLTLVRAGHSFPSDSAGAVAFRHMVADVQAILGRPTDCFSALQEPNTVHFAHWPTDSMHVYVQYSTADGAPESDEALALPARVLTVVSRSAPAIPRRITPTAEACPSETP